MAHIVVAGALALVASEASAQWHRDYENGKRALGENRAAEARQLFEKALREGPSPGPRVRYFGMRYDEFFPNYYLGKACSELGERDCALQYLEASESLDNINDGSLLNDRARLLGNLRRADLGPALGRIRTMLAGDRIGAASSEIEKLKTENPNQANSDEITQLERDIAARRSEAEGAIQDAQAALDQGETDRAERLLADVENVDVIATDIRRLRQRIGQAVEDADDQEARRTAALEIEEHLRGGRLGEAAQRWESLREMDPNGSETTRLSDYLNRARAANDAFQQQRYERSESLFKQLALRYTDNSWARVMARTSGARLADRADEDLVRPTDEGDGSGGEDEGTTDLGGDDVTVPGGDPDPNVEAESPIERARALLDGGRLTLAWEVAQETGAGAERGALLAEIREAAYDTARRGVRRIFSGADSRIEAVELLDEARGPLADRAKYHLYLALAYHYLFLYEETSEYLASAEESIRNALEIDANIQPDPALFHPDLRKLIEDSRQGS